MSVKIVLEYLSDLKDNNGMEWYNANKKRYQEAKAEFEALLTRLIPLMCSLGAADDRLLGLDPKDLIFRLNRDARFSDDKTPYNTAFRACLSPAGKKPIPVGFYISVSPGGSFLGGGLFSAIFKDAVAMIRERIYSFPEEFDAVVKNAAFAPRFTVRGEALKNVPRGFDPGHRHAEYLKNKSWYLEYPVSDNTVTSDDFPDAAAQIFWGMKPFNDFLNEALKNFKMPSECRLFGRKTKI